VRAESLSTLLNVYRQSRAFLFESQEKAGWIEFWRSTQVLFVIEVDWTATGVEEAGSTLS